MFARRTQTMLLCVAIASVSVAATAGPLVVVPNNNAVTLVNALVNGASGITVVSGSEVYTGAAAASGTFTGGTGIIPFDTGILLTSGSAAGAVGPNNTGSFTVSNNTAGDAALTTLAGAPTFDAANLEFDFIPSSPTISFQYVFGSEEYNTFVGSQFNDVFGFFLNGANIALIPGTSSPVTINGVNCYSNANYFTSNNLESDNSGRASCGNAGLNTQYDGLVGGNAAFQLFAVGSVNVGAVNHIKLAVADTSDRILDSGVFLRGGSFVNQPPPTSVVPEPGTLMLLGSGVLAAARRRRNAR